MMNREAIVIELEYLQLARSLCDQVGALMALDEIQTGFWFPEVIYAKRIGVEPDFIVLGKGMTAGFHPLAALVYRGRLDILEQYDAISTNGNAALAAYLALGCIAMVERDAEHIAEAGEHYHERMRELAADFPEFLVEARGAAHMSALKFREVEDALGFHRAAASEACGSVPTPTMRGTARFSPSSPCRWTPRWPTSRWERWPSCSKPRHGSKETG